MVRALPLRGVAPALCLALALTLAVVPAVAAPDAHGYQHCVTRLARQFWQDLRVKDYRCVDGAQVARHYIHARPFGDRRGYTTDGFRCQLDVLGGVDNPYGRVTCTREARRVRFYGVS